MTIQANIEAKSKAYTKLTAHCLCARIEPGMVYLPYGYGVDALRIVDTADCYIKAEAYLEKVWQDSCFWK